MYRKLLGGTAIALALAASPALAADMGYPVKAPPMMAVVPVFTWTGFYIGANVGYGWGDASGYSPYDNSDYAIITGLVTSGSGDPDGWFGGLQAGYNYQFYNNVVLGLEADVQFADMKSTYSYGYTVTDLGSTPVDDPDFGVSGKYTTKIDTFGTVRARLGYAMDRFLPYVTGGLAWANVKVSGNTVIDGDNLSGWSGSHQRHLLGLGAWWRRRICLHRQLDHEGGIHLFRSRLDQLRRAVQRAMISTSACRP